ncbi:MAG: DNA pilot protein [Microviridae sp.]|nr:MAG: DNA pilot protein [Microviridae sp.]
MDPIVTSALLAGGSKLLGGLTSAFGAKNQMSQKSAMRMQQNINQEQMKFGLVEGPSWEMSGLKKAGINPLLRYGQSGTPTGVTAQGVSQGTPINKLSDLGAAMGDIGTTAADAYSKLTDAKKTEAEINKLGEEIKNLGVNRRLSEAQIGTEQQRMWQLFGQRLLQTAQVSLTESQTKQLVAMFDQIEAQTGFIKVQTRLQEKYASLADIVVDIIEAVKQGSDDMSSLPVVPNKDADTLVNDLLGWSLF